MASLRDVFSHAGKKVRLEGATGPTREGLAMRRGDVGLFEPKLEPIQGDVVVFLETGERFQIQDPQTESVMGKIDHYRARLAPSRG